MGTGEGPEELYTTNLLNLVDVFITTAIGKVSQKLTEAKLDEDKKIEDISLLLLDYKRKAAVTDARINDLQEDNNILEEKIKSDRLYFEKKSKLFCTDIELLNNIIVDSQ